jgi:hypothetical protein
MYLITRWTKNEKLFNFDRWIVVHAMATSQMMFGNKGNVNFKDLSI